MQDFEKLGIFYLGKQYDPAAKTRSENLLLYESRDLVTHAVCVGMTGSGKTGLCLSLLEEAAMDGIPALIIDPKGDLGNLLLTFPSLAARDFRPWINEDDARRKGTDPDTFAAQQAELWKNGLAQWGQDGPRIAAMRANCDFTIYTPGSDAGVPVSVLRSFDAPPEAVIDDRELFRDRIGATATAILGLVGITADPIQSREHILLSNLFDAAWRNGQSLDLPSLIHQVQTPPMSKIGVLDLEAFYPAKDRFQLAMALNNLLASPGFEAWLNGDPLEIQSLLYTPQGKPRMSIFSIAHLNDSERMFFVALLLNQTLSWMRQQSGTTSLRALLYMDEIFGYFPPIGEPPSKRPLLTLLKQARAFGLGVVLATQNPVDLDYKGLANTGTWFIGRLQTERDKNRVLDGLEGVAATAGGASFDRQQMDQLLSALGNRIFLLNNVHRGAPQVFETRWAMSYLRGPLTRTQIRTLMADHKLALAAAQPAGSAASKPVAGESAKTARPVLPPDVPQFFLPARGTEVTYRPMLYCAAEVKFLDAKKGVDITKKLNVLAPITSDATPVSWEDAEETDVETGELEKTPVEGASYEELPPAAGKAKSYPIWQKDFVNWIFSNRKIDLFQSPSSGELSLPDESERDFRVRLQTVARERRDAEVEAMRQKYGPKLAALEEKIRRAENALAKEQQQKQSATLVNAISIGSSLLGALFGSRKVSTGIGKAATAARGVGRIQKEAQDVGIAEANLEALRQQYADLEATVKEQTDAIAAAANPATEKFEIVSVRPKKTGITARLCALTWVPEE
jgi:hypothetical protein